MSAACPFFRSGGRRGTRGGLPCEATHRAARPAATPPKQTTSEHAAAISTAQGQSGPAMSSPARRRYARSRSVLVARLLLTLVARRLDVAAQLDIALVARVLEDLVVV